MDLADNALAKLRRFNAPLGWAALYLASGLLVAMLQPGDSPYLWYPPIAIGITVLHRVGLRFWPLLLAVDFIVSFYQFGDATDALVISACTVVELVAAAFALRLVKPTFGIVDHRDLARLILICVGAGLLGSSLGGGAFHLIYGDQGLSVDEWLSWWFGDATSSVSLLPLLLVLTNEGSEYRAPPQADTPHWESAGLLVSAIGAAYVSSGHATLLPVSLQDTLAPIMFAPVIWASLRFNMRTTAIAIMTISVSAALFRWWDGLPGISGTELSHHAILHAQIFISALSIIGMSLSLALQRERRARAEAESRETELRRATEGLRTALTRLSLAAEAGHIGVWDWNLSDDSAQWDDQIFAMYQIDPKTADKSKAWMERVHPEDAERLEREIVESVQHGKEIRSNFRVVWPSGEVRYLNTHAVIQANADGKAMRIIGIDYDVTDLVRQRLKAEENEVKAATANRAKSEFLAIMSHELRTPLNAIIGFSDLMIRGAFGPLQNERYVDYAKDINQSGQLLLSLINDILDLARIEAGKREFTLQAMEPGEVLDDITRLLAPLAHRKSIHLELAGATTNQPLVADARALRQLLNNLVTNAIKFSEDGGTVTLGAEKDSDAQVTLVVTDHGRGIPRERIADLCKPFVQIADPLRRDVGGIGLGLAISRSLTEAMGGTLEIHSELGKGTIVRVKLPAAA